jgi:hypothetical protein
MELFPVCSLRKFFVKKLEIIEKNPTIHSKAPVAGGKKKIILEDDLSSRRLTKKTANEENPKKPNCCG